MERLKSYLDAKASLRDFLTLSLTGSGPVSSGFVSDLSVFSSFLWELPCLLTECLLSCFFWLLFWSLCESECDLFRSLDESFFLSLLLSFLSLWWSLLPWWEWWWCWWWLWWYSCCCWSYVKKLRKKQIITYKLCYFKKEEIKDFTLT